MRNTENRTITQALAVYLFWLKTGLDQSTLATLFEIDSQFEVSAYLSQVRQALVKDFVSSNLGAAWASRSGFLRKISFIAEKLFSANNGQLILVADGTYCYIKKSRNNKFQRCT